MLRSGADRPGMRDGGRLRRVQIVCQDGGFTLVELMVVMVIAGVLMTIGVFSFANYQKVSQQRGTAREVVSLLRNASERAISEGRTYCVGIDAAGAALETWQYTCRTRTPSDKPLQTASTQSTKVTLAATVTNPSPAPPCPSSYSCVYFYPRGTATPTTVVVRSSARSKTYTVTVEGLTARVFSPEL